MLMLSTLLQGQTIAIVSRMLTLPFLFHNARLGPASQDSIADSKNYVGQGDEAHYRVNVLMPLDTSDAKES